MKKLISILIGRPFAIAFLILLQFLILIGLVYSLGMYIYTLTIIFRILSYLTLLYIINRQDNPSYKLAWSIGILAFPEVGWMCYLLLGGRKIPKALQKDMILSVNESMPLLVQNETVLNDLAKHDFDLHRQMSYVLNNAYFPIYNQTKVNYFSSGEEIFPEIIAELKKAKHFIFMEYFIVDYGYFWDEVLAVLKQKVQENVEIKFLYDDGGCVNTLSNSFIKEMNTLGIKCAIFNPLKARLAVTMNNRDHRKITVIDNQVAFMGGFNLADEYINKISRFGYWKDSGCKITGDAVWSATVMFLQFYNYAAHNDKIEYDDYYLQAKTKDHSLKDNYVQIFSDSPTDSEPLGLNVHLNLINNAKDYIYIHTPYLVIDHTVKSSLILAAKNGVDVRIIVPYIPDKWYVLLVTQAQFKELIEGGVRVYEYTPGFIHSKAMFIDDKIGLCGTINMDYRSYYLHYECGILYNDAEEIKKMKADYFATLNECHEVTLLEVINYSLIKRLLQALFNLLSPLM